MALVGKPVRIRLGIVVPLQLLLVAAFVMAAPAITRFMAERSQHGAFPRTPASADSSSAEGLGIQALIHDVKAELAASEIAEEALGHRPLFEIKTFDLELSFVAQSSSRGLGKVDYKVVTAENEASLSAEQVQKLTLRFDAVPKTNGLSSQNETDPEPSGAQALGEAPPMRTIQP